MSNPVFKVFGYPYLFYSIYKYVSSKWGGSRDFPQGWAVSTLCAVVAFAYMTADMYLSKFGVRIFLTGAYPDFLKTFGPLIVICIINYAFFFIGSRWRGYVDRYDKLPRNVRIIGHCFSGVIVLGILFSNLYMFFSAV